MKSENGIEIEIGQRAMVLRNDEDYPTIDTGEGPMVDDILGVLGVVMHVCKMDSDGTVLLRDNPDETEANVVGWFGPDKFVILQEAP